MYLFDFSNPLDTNISIINMFNASKKVGNNLFTSGVWLHFDDCAIIAPDKRPVGVRESSPKHAKTVRRLTGAVNVRY